MITRGVKIYKRHKEVLNYLVVGGLTTVVSILSYYLFRLVIDNYLINTVLSWICSVIFAYTLNRKYVFESNNANITKEFAKFTYYRLMVLVVEMIIMFALVALIAMDDRIAKIIVQFIIVALNYIFSKLFVFKKKQIENK